MPDTEWPETYHQKDGINCVRTRVNTQHSPYILECHIGRHDTPLFNVKGVDLNLLLQIGGSLTDVTVKCSIIQDPQFHQNCLYVVDKMRNLLLRIRAGTEYLLTFSKGIKLDGQ